MAYEIDFLPVGNGRYTGDAIALRWGNLNGRRDEQHVVIIDGGTKTSGEAMVNHIKSYYGTDQVDLVISTHPDTDHICGLGVVMEGLNVKRLWMHRPWEHSEEIRDRFHDGRITDSSLKERIREALQGAYDLEKLANDGNIPIIEPFQGEYFNEGEILVLGPGRDFYQDMLTQSDKTPAVAAEGLGESVKTLTGFEISYENFETETLTEPSVGTSPMNNSSTVLYLTLDGVTFLLTADAGIEALNSAADYAAQQSLDLRSVRFYQIPHHGSKRNVSGKVLDRIVGAKLDVESYSKVAYVSCPPEGEPKHPAKKVVNAFKRRGAQVYATKGGSIWHHSADAPQRSGWVPLVPLEFSSLVEN